MLPFNIPRLALIPRAVYLVLMQFIESSKKIYDFIAFDMT